MVWYRRQNNIGISRADYLNMIQDIVDPIRFDTRKPDMMAFLSGRDKMGVDIPGKLLVQKVNANKYRYKLLVERSAAKALSISVSWTFTKSGVAVGTGRTRLRSPREQDTIAWREKFLSRRRNCQQAWN